MSASPLRHPASATCAPDRAYPAADVAAAEARLTAGTDRYMRAAAHAVAGACLRELRQVRGTPAGGRVLALVGGGSNGADALLACALLARRGCAVTALLGTGRSSRPAVHEAQEAGVRVLDGHLPPDPSRGPSPPRLSRDAQVAVTALRREGGVVIDGLTGTGGAGPLRPAAAALVTPFLAEHPPGPAAWDGAAGGDAGAAGDTIGSTAGDTAGDAVAKGGAGGGAGDPAAPPSPLMRPPGRVWRVVAVDVPSGTGVDDGTLPGPVLPADRTVTFTCLKGALCLPPACHLAGCVEVVDLDLPVPRGQPLALRPTQADLARPLRVPGTRDHKYTRGVVGLWAGSTTYPGAAVLAASGAVRAGAGMVRLSAPRRVEDLVLAARPEVVPTAGRCQAVVVGPGTAPDDYPRAEELGGALRAVLRQGGRPGDSAPGPGREESRKESCEESRKEIGRRQRAGASPAGAGTVPAVVDAGALALLPSLLGEGLTCGPEHVLTPHAGEAARLLTALGRRWTRSQVEEQPAAAARCLSGATGATVVLKGAVTLVVTPGGVPVCVDGGPSWLATAGSGDVLAGVLGALLAAVAAEGPQGGAALLDPAVLAVVVAAGVQVHALAGTCASRCCAEDLGGAGHPVTALDVADSLPTAWSRLTRSLYSPQQSVGPVRGHVRPARRGPAS